jgi:hypothetical protein
MSGTAIASVFALGPRITAQVLGLPFAQYRCGNIGPVIQTNNLIATLPAWITADAKLSAATAFAYGKPSGYAAIDPALTLVGDYLVGSITVSGPSETFFIASQDIPAPIQVIRCNHTLIVSRMQSTITPGGSGQYGGDVTADATVIATGWPGSLLSTGSKTTPNAMALPSDAKLGTFTILLPGNIPGPLFANDTITDEMGNRYVLSAAEISPLGWRLTADQWKQG